MKNRIQFLMGVFAMVAACIGCSAPEESFTHEELMLINSGRGVMRVLKSDSPEDTVVLRAQAKALSDRMIQSETFGTLCRRMLETVQSPENDGVGIAGPQVGISRRVVAVQRFDKDGEPFEFYVNPVIVRYGEDIAPGAEGCLSVPDFRGTVERSQEIDLQYRTMHGTDTIETVKGFTAVIFQHEIDHLDGMLYTDRAILLGDEFMETRALGDGSKLIWIQDNSEPRKMPASLFPDADVSLMKSLGLEDGIPSTVSVFLLEKDGLRILFDAGNGAGDSRLMTSLNKMGVGPEDIDHVYITHLHGDHIGGLFNGAAAAFPHADLCVAVDEFEGWMNMPSDRNEMQRRMASAYEGRIRLFTAGDILPGGVETIDAYGHTPGHTAYRCGNLLIVGDILHGAALQMEHPEICAAFDMNKEEAVMSRIRILEYAEENGLMMFGMHFPAPMAGK